MWFWCKFLVGLVAVLSVLDGTTILASWNSPRVGLETGMSWAYVGCFPILHALMYVLAVFGTCWIRKPVIGALLAVLGYAVLSVAISTLPVTTGLDPINVYNELLRAERSMAGVDFRQHGYPLVYGVLAGLIVTLALGASHLVRPLEPPERWFAPMTA
jgi:hypothetical protein